MSRALMLGWAAVLALAQCLAAAEAAKKELTPQEMLRILTAQKASLVRVEYTLQTDKGEDPDVRGWGERCPNCGRYHGFDAGDLIKEERPLAVAGFVLAPDRVISADPIIPLRFVKKIEIRQGEKVVAAKHFAYGLNQNAVVLQTSAPLDAKPLVFAAERKPPYFAVNYAEENGEWEATIKPFSGPVSHAEKRGSFSAAPSSCLIVDEAGGAVGMCFRDEVPTDDSWKGSPETWSWLAAEDLAAKQSALAQKLEKSLLRVTLKFRSPRKQAGSRYRFRFNDDDDESEATERQVAGVAMDEKTLLVLALLAPAVTTRLERIVVHASDGKTIAAKFKATLADYGCLVAETESPLAGIMPLAEKDIRDFRHSLLLAADVRIQGENRIVYLDHNRIASFERGWRDQVYPLLRGEGERIFLFDPDGLAVAMPVIRREKVAARERYSRENPKPTPVALLRACFADLAKNSDPNNAPRSEAEENRLAWLGTELQPLDKELARANKVSDLTKDGEFGAMVSFVYADSPAAKAGVEAGWILLRLHVEGQPKPLEVKLDEDYEGRNFPWERLDQVPEQYFDEIPQPWQSVENSLTRALTDIGFGVKYKAEFFNEGQIVEREMAIECSPPHYDAAPRFKAQSLGITVRDLTYEVRRYYQINADDPGVVISKIEPGSKVSVSGIKPYEVITHVNDAPVRNVKEFENAIQGRDELRLNVKRMAKSRIVKIKMTGEPEKKTAPAEPPAPEEPE